MVYDYSKLRGRIVEKVGSNLRFAELMGVSENTMSMKLNNKRSWSQADISNASSILNIKPEEISSYFFTKKVH